MTNHAVTARKLIAITLLAGVTLSLPAQPLKLVTAIDPSRTPSAAGNGDSGVSTMSPDGRFVLFASSAKNLALVDTNQPLGGIFPSPLNVFLRDRTQGTTTLVTVNSSATGGGNADSFPTAVSTNGRYALFESTATDLVQGDTNNAADVFLRDLVSGTTVLVSINTNNLPANGPSRASVMTPDGRFVAFVSEANNLVPADTNTIPDVFVRDLQGGKTTLVSVGACPGPLPVGSSESPVITPDGRFVAFYSTATNLVPGVPTFSGTTRLGDVYVRDLTTATTTWASKDARSAAQSVLGKTNVFSFNYSLSDDGQFVAYETSPNLTSSGLILRYQLPTGLTELGHTNAAVVTSSYPDISSLNMTPDGRFIAFVANTNGTSGSTTCILVWDAQTDVIQLASGNSANTVPVSTTCSSPVLDSFGRYVAFVSDAPGLVTNSVADDFHLYLRDLEAGTTTLIDADPDGFGVGADPTTVPLLSADARLVLFESFDTDLVPEDTNDAYDVFIRDLVQGTNELISVRHPALPCLTPNGLSSISTSPLSCDARFVAFASDADDLVLNDSNGFRDVFVRDLLAGTNLLVSVNTNGVTADGFSSEPAISADGRYVLFTSQADDLIVGDTNKAQDVFLRDLQVGTTILVSVKTNGTGPGNKASSSPLLSSNGRFALFRSTSVDLGPGPFSSAYPEKLFLRDLQFGKTYVLTTNLSVGLISVTPDGRFVAFHGATSPGTSGYIYVWDTQAAARVSTNAAVGVSGLAISPDGSRLAYSTNSALAGQVLIIDLNARTNWAIASYRTPSRVGLRFSSDSRYLAYAAMPDTTTYSQIYLYDFQTGTNLLASQAYSSGAPGNVASDSPDISPDGRFVAYRSDASNLVPNDNNGVPDIFLFDRLSGSTTLLTTSLFGSHSADNRSLSPSFSADGQMLLFQSWASDLAPGDFNNSSDLFALSLFSSSPIPVFSARILPPAPGQQCTLTWPVLPGKTYRVQFKNSLEDLDWQELKSGLTIIGTQGYFSDPASASGQRFYRIVAF